MARLLEVDDRSLIATIQAALEGDSNDAEHDALSEVASALGIAWTAFDDVEGDEE